MGLQVEWNGLEGRVVCAACLYFIINKNKNIKNGPPGNTNKSGKTEWDGGEVDMPWKQH